MSTDQERATAFICTHLGFDPMESTGDIEALAGCFRAARLDERAAIGRWLRSGKRVSAPDAAFADLIERGAHEAPR